jgi:probable rRNA maturation factor
MPDLVETVIEDDHWTALDLGARAEAACRAVLAELDLPAEEYEIALLGCDDARIAALNADFRDKPTPTNVLSWPADDLAAEADGDDPWLPPEAPEAERLALGDIAIAWETCAREAAEQGKAHADHVTHLLVHGCLHLLGYDHVREKDAALMEGLEVQILAKLGVADPY